MTKRKPDDNGEIVIELHNRHDSPDFFDIESDRGTVPKGATVDLMLPDARGHSSGPSSCAHPRELASQGKRFLHTPHFGKAGRRFSFFSHSASRRPYHGRQHVRGSRGSRSDPHW